MTSKTPKNLRAAALLVLTASCAVGVATDPAAVPVNHQTKAGKSLPDIAVRGLPAKYDSMGSAFINEDAYITAVINSSK